MIIDNVAAPHIHLNGTSAERLVDGLIAVADKLEEAYQALREAAPNGRDYYPLGREAMDAAERQHERRLRAIDEIKANICREIELIQEQTR